MNNKYKTSFFKLGSSNSFNYLLLYLIENYFFIQQIFFLRYFIICFNIFFILVIIHFFSSK